MTVQVRGVPMPLGDFVKGSLDRELFWAETRPGTRAVELQMASIACYKCRKTIKAVRGYVINNHFVPLAEVSDTGALAAFVSALRQHLPEVTPVSQRFSSTVQANISPRPAPFARHCSGTGL